MRKIILNVAVSLDGFIEGPNGEYDWCMTDQDYGMEDFLANTDTILFGRKSYELFQKEGGDMWQDKKRYVFSTTLASVEGATLLKDANVETINGIRNAEGKNIWLFGGAKLLNSLLQQRLVDQLLLSIHPILLGNGTPLFPALQNRMQFELVGCETYSTGLVQAKYQLAANAG